MVVLLTAGLLLALALIKTPLIASRLSGTSNTDPRVSPGVGFAIYVTVTLAELILGVLLLPTRTRAAALSGVAWLSIGFIGFALLAASAGAADCKCFGALLRGTRDTRLLFGGLLLGLSTLCMRHQEPGAN